MMRRLIPLIIATGLLIILAGCQKPKEAAPTATAPARAGLAPSGELTVFVPCGVAGPFGQTKAIFEQRYPNCKVRPQLANIDVQTKLIADGKAAPDVWLALGDREMQRVTAQDRVDGQPVTYAYNSIAFIVKKGNPCGIEAVTDLTKKSVKTVAMATPENSSGYYAEQAFRKSGVWDTLEKGKKLWLTPEPAQIKVTLSAGKADVGVVYYPCTRETRIVGGKQQEMPGKVQLLGKLPTELVGQIPAQAAVIKGAANPDAGRAFLALLLEDQVQDIWENWAFDRAKQPATGARTSLYLYAGAGLRPMLDAASEEFKKLNPKVHLDIGYAGSGCLLSQLTFSKRGDLYMPGEDFYLKQASERGFISSEKPVGCFEPVLLVQKGNPKGIKTLADLAKPKMKVGLGEPEAAAVGRAADELLKKAGLFEQVNRNVVFRAGNVPELGNSVKLKSVDVAIVWNVTAAQQTKDCDVVAIDKALYQPSLAPIGMLKFSKHPAEAQAFIDFLCSSEGQAIVKQSGMVPAVK
ncbi:MAG: molybdate ABC transporter substrate-binding protein [Armatimonadia bacterium]